jgi:hypothetical protein
MSFFDPTRDLNNVRYDYLPSTVENTDRWTLIKTVGGYTLTDKQSSRVVRLEFSGADATRLEMALKKSWKDFPNKNLNSRFNTIWNRFVRQVPKL